MKKIFYLIVGASLIGGAALSCSKEVVGPTENPETTEEQLPGTDEQTDPAEDPVPSGKVRLTFGVSHENDAVEGDESKTSWDGTTHAWSDGDQIRILWGTGESDFVDAEVKNGKVTADVVEADNYYAVYPTTATYALDLTEGELTITVPRYQSGNFSDANIMAAKTSKADAALNFKNMTSILKFTTGTTYSYNSASFMANDKSVKLTGEVHTTFPDEFAVTTTNEVMKQDIICIQPNNPTGNPGMEASTTYYLAMLPGAAIDNGIGFKIESRMGNSTDLIAGGLSKSSFARERSKVYDLGTLDSRIVKDWYITETGTGNGASTDNPGGPARLMELLNPTYSATNTTAGWRLVNAIIHVAAGTYNLQESNGGTVFDPHYNMGSLVAHVKGEGTDANPTKFVCNENDGDRIVALTGTNCAGTFTFENITFTATKSFSTDGIAFFINSTGQSDKKNIITFKDCVFIGLTSTVSSGNGYGGAAVNIYSGGTYSIVFDGCKFNNNTAVRGGAIALTNSGDNSNVSFKDCSFYNNMASSNQGGAVYVYAKGKTTFDHTSFTGDGSTSTAANGGAIAIINGGKVTLQNGSSIDKCVTNGNGGAVFNHGSLVLDNTSISNCKGKVGGAIYSDGDITIRNNSEIDGNQVHNSGTNGGAIYLTYSTSGNDAPSLDIENSCFSSNSSTNGAVIYGNKSSNGHPIVTRVFNTLFKSNAASGGASSGANRNGGCIYANDYNYLLFANCTFSDNTVGTGGIISMGRNGSTDYNVMYLVSSTIGGPNDGIQRNSKVNRVYNSIVLGNKTNTAQNLSLNHSIWGTGGKINIYGASELQTNGNYANTASDTDITFALGEYQNGVYPLNSDYSTLYGKGMSVEDIQKLEFTNITLTDEQKALLAKDQKGNDRSGTIMGAYVSTTAPTE